MTSGVSIVPAFSFEGWRNRGRGEQHLERLFAELSPYQGRGFDLKQLEDQSHFFMAEDCRKPGCLIVGMVRLVSKTDQTSQQRSGVLHDEVVDSQYRGQGIGKALTLKVIEVAKMLEYTHIDAFPKQKRVEANKMYQSLGFELITPADPTNPESANHYRFML